MPDDKDKPQIIREQRITYDDYARLEDGNRYELNNGKLELMSPGPSSIHQLISAELQYKLRQTCNREYIVLSAPIDLILSETEVRQPDLVLIRRSRLHILAKHGIVGVPDLVTEIVSPSTLKRDKLDKLKIYARFGIPEYWIIASDASTLEQYVLVKGEARYELHNIYLEDDPVQSDHLSCVSFTMNDIRLQIPNIDSEV